MILNNTNMNIQTIEKRDLVLIAIFGTFWGLIEISLGAFLKGLKIPLSGTLLASISVLICLTGISFIRKKNAAILMGAVAAFIKLFSIGVFILSPFFAILMEALLAEICIRVFRINLFSFVITGIVVLFYPMIHPFLFQGLIYGSDIYHIYIETFYKFLEWIGLNENYLYTVIIIYVSVHIIAGTLAGLIAHIVSKSVKLKLESSKNE